MPELPPTGKEQRPTVNQALELLDKLDERGAGLQRRASRLAWASTSLALVILAAISAAGYDLEQKRKAAAADLRVEVEKLKGAKSELSLAKQELTQLNERKTKLDEEIKNLSVYKAMLEQFKPKQVIEVSKKLPEGSAPPRVFLQIIDQGDRAEAKKKGDALQKAGNLVLGVEYVPGIRLLKVTEVRYYKAADLPVAQQIVDILKAAGVESATIKYLKEQDRPDVKGNTFEVWFAQGLR